MKIANKTIETRTTYRAFTAALMGKGLEDWGLGLGLGLAILVILVAGFGSRLEMELLNEMTHKAIQLSSSLRSICTCSCIGLNVYIWIYIYIHGILNCVLWT